MPLTPCPNESRECATDDCDKFESPLWYGKRPNKICKKCYDKFSKKRARSSPPAGAAEVQPEQAGDTLVSIIKI